ncbi:MAG: 2-amino-4-hydroxy-6-hydroxymethyldihydropteridine diphosphokinase [Saprospiraceae bacterium]|nr:2-amino-4-hydroxy-6-hydroxymethyldihydropteridine diphosphokinase [Saprospiraceae bacterium]
MRLFLGLGSNLGDRKQNLQRATEQVETHIGEILKASSIYETQAWGIENQPDFLNQVLEINTQFEPEKILEIVLIIEQNMGRERQIKWGERLIDIDILFYENWVLRTEKLMIPHPFLQDRNFVLAPLVEIAPDFVHPVLQRSIRDLFLDSKDHLVVKILTE